MNLERQEQYVTTTTTLADLAGTSLAAVRILESHGLDYCCGGKRAVEDACIAKNLNPNSVLQEIEAANLQHADERDWQTAPLDELVTHIVATHHEYLKVELPALDKRLAKVHEVHGARDPVTLARMVEVFGALREELEMHMQKEEVILFPFIQQYGVATARGLPLPKVPFGSIANPIRVMEREHDTAGDELGELRRLTGNYQLPIYACSTVKALYEGLQSFEADLHIHIHLENNILFPRAIALEKK
jgi:regulator of cell morphogenesis and NO signaling